MTNTTRLFHSIQHETPHFILSFDPTGVSALLVRKSDLSEVWFEHNQIERVIRIASAALLYGDKSVDLSFMMLMDRAIRVQGATE